MADPAIEACEDLLTPSLVARFRATLDVLESAAADGLPPGLHWCLCTPDAPQSRMGPDGHPLRGLVTAPPALPRRMWAASEIEWHGSMQVGARVIRQSCLLSMEPRTGRQGPLAFATIAHEWQSNGRPVITERQTLVFRAPPDPRRKPAAEPESPAAGTWQMAQRIHPTTALLFRYSAVTFNSHRIHYDLPYATRIEGYPGLVVQGPLLATLLMQVARHWLGESLRHFAFRAVRPAFAGQPLDLMVQPAGQGLHLAVWDSAGRACMTAQAAA